VTAFCKFTITNKLLFLNTKWPKCHMSCFLSNQQE
jgi:hypothetical protein